MAERHDAADVPLRSLPADDRRTIGAFARDVGLSASALRQYGESGLITPALVEPRTGYRYYAADQQQRAIWVRRLRDAGLGLSSIGAVLDSDLATARRVLDSWLAEIEEDRSIAAELAADLILDLRSRQERNPVRRTTFHVDGAVLATAVEQLTAGAPAGARSMILLDADESSVALVTTDRYLLMARLAVSTIASGPAVRMVLPAERTSTWARHRPQVIIDIDAPAGRDATTIKCARFSDDHDELVLEPERDLFPDARALLHARSEEIRSRVVLPRVEVSRAAGPGADDVTIVADPDAWGLRSSTASVSGSARGAIHTLTLSAAMVRRVAESAVGPLLTAEFGGTEDPVIWRAPAQPDFVALMMPRSP